MSKIVAETSQLHAFDISVSDAKFWLLVFKVFGHTAGQVSDTWRNR